VLDNLRPVHPNVERVAAALRAGGVAADVRELDESTRTAAEAAAALDVPVGAIVKSLLFLADGDPVLVLASGDHQVDTTRVAAVLEVTTVKRADADAVRAATGFPIGGVPPIAHQTTLRTIVDRHLATYPVLWAAAGTPRAVFPTSYDDLLRLSGGVPADVGVT
jgi:prolyl-tRNA editing enzyme YbaK/EbsC (Cys-tRNA(Pro) deacylase)